MDKQRAKERKQNSKDQKTHVKIKKKLAEGNEKLRPVKKTHHAKK